jgi:hypothetical protein
MRKIKSSPANLCEMAHCKKVVKTTKTQSTFILLNNESKNENENENNFKQITLNKKKVSTIHTALITDTYFEISKKIPDLDNYYFNGMIDIINSFISNKFNKQNFENLVLSIIIRFIFSTICHDILFKINELPQIDIY